MSEALDRVMEVLAGVSEEEVTAALAAVGASRPRSLALSDASRTPLPVPESTSQIVCEVEWV
ncbi:hypothetical protein [Streptomyces broussonetiae]|uniref:Uncharacterized protein n=1 Tax=Streptomyces broussonetiae TaxID=2686304 RepID=A0A6I6N245_9ACTN|nr:hypothetical protein [Streptomyces broussonetiae]QHA04689.1 hypothetical protein GQF42_16555 [Streptomyces broussonetiae]